LASPIISLDGRRRLGYTLPHRRRGEGHAAPRKAPSPLPLLSTKARRPATAGSNAEGWDGGKTAPVTGQPTLGLQSGRQIRSAPSTIGWVEGSRRCTLLGTRPSPRVWGTRHAGAPLRL